MAYSAYWRAALKGDPAKIFKRLDDWEEPQPGFYRIRRVNWREKGFRSPFYPVAIWKSEMGNGMLAKVGINQTITDEMRILDLWLKGSKNPVTEDAYRHAVAYGTWADDPPPKEPKPEVEDLTDKTSMFD